MARLCGACCGLLIFSATIFGGLLSGADAEKIMLRALVGLFGGLALGCLTGWIGLFVVRDQLDRATDDRSESPEKVERGMSESNVQVVR